MKRILTIIMAAALLCCLTTALAGSAGSSADPLMSKEYIDGAYTDAVLSSGQAKIDEAFKTVHDNVAASVASGSDNVATGNDIVTLGSGKSLKLGMGTSVIVISGSVKTLVKSGTLLNIRTAEAVSTGSELSLNTRYFCVEDTEVVITATKDAVAAINGRYESTDETAIIEGGDTDDPEGGYTDVPETAWYYDASVYAYNNKLFRDYTTGLFNDSYCTRAEVVYALWMAVGSPECETVATFTDLTEDWYMDAVSWSVENGIINGCGDNTFEPDVGIIREQFACVMYRYAAYVGEDMTVTSDLSKFTDEADIASWAYKEMAWCNAVGIITGTSATEMSPLFPLTRSQIATVLMRYVSK